MAGVVRSISGLPFRFGGEAHTGWLPPGTAKPPLTPVEDVLLDLRIEFEGQGYLLIWASRDGRHHGDLWFERMEDAVRQASEDFGADENRWQAVTNRS